MKPCILPWINFSTNTFGRPRTCGYADQSVVKQAQVKLKGSSIANEWNNDYFKHIRKEFLEGRWPENCKRCEYVESLKGNSKRIEENYYHYDNNEHLLEQTAQDGSVPYYPSNIDIRVGTICNLKCIHCGTGASSKWNEDKAMLDKYPNTEFYNIDNKWIEQDSFIWDNIKENLNYTKRFNFLGGEPFANKQHNKFIQDISQTEYAKDITLSYVSNGTLLTEKIFEQLKNFKLVIIRLSLDAIQEPGEYFRFPIKWNTFKTKLELMQKYAKHYSNFDIGVQWTCSNISMFYLTETFDFMQKNYPNIEFILANHVEWPVHMSAQVLPNVVKKIITDKIENYNFGKKSKKVPFYLNHMNEKNLWPEYGKTFINYLDDLDCARNINWKHSFKEIELHKYELI
jgi:sulfatase maturation enzyme AslB (radical SAM superfamily)